MPFPYDDEYLESDGGDDLAPAVGIGRALLAILAAWAVVLGMAFGWTLSTRTKAAAPSARDSFSILSPGARHE